MLARVIRLCDKRLSRKGNTMKHGIEYEEYLEYLNHLFLSRMDDVDYLSFMLQSNLGEM
jgi:hypothetical protein